MTDRLARIRAAMDEAGIDGLLIDAAVEDHFGRHAENRRYASGFTGSTGRALITRDGAFFAADFRYTEQAKREVVPRGFEVFEALGAMKEWLPRLFEAAGLQGKRLGVSKSDISLEGWLALQERVAEMPEASRPKLEPAPLLVEKLRSIKDAEELALLQRAIDIADRSFEALEPRLQPEMTELDVAALFEAGVLGLGAQGISFETIVAAGPWGAMPHAQPRPEPLGKGRPIVIDMGARFADYASDLTRTVVICEPDAKFREIYAIVFEAQQNAIEHVEPGMTGKQAHRLAADVIARYGYGERFGHGLGHGIGLLVHESPYLGMTSEDVLEEGMVFTIEPGIYLPGWGGVRIEDVVVLENGRARVLSHARKLTPAGV